MALTEEQSLRQAIAREEAISFTLEQKSRGRLAALKAEPVKGRCIDSTRNIPKEVNEAIRVVTKI